MPVTVPNESQEYRAARSRLLEEEAALRQHIEDVAALRRALPKGGQLKRDYAFHEWVGGKEREVLFSDLFRKGHVTLFAYSFMYAPTMDAACPACASFIDGLNGQALHIGQTISMAIIAQHEPKVLQDFADSRGWNALRIISSAGTTYNADYRGEVEGKQTTNANVFRRDSDTGAIHHFWGSELAAHDLIENGDSRHVDLMWPLWNVLDVTPDGRGEFRPKLAYD